MLSRHGLTACALAAALLAATAQEAPPQPIGEIFASDASVKGSVQLAGAGMQVMSGSSIGAGQQTALLRLRRGGEVRICPRTTLSIGSAQGNLMFGMNTGALEAEYSLPATADVILTPDFRILLAGPGKFHIAVGSDARGTTCVRPLADNAASVIVSELMGEAVYQVKPGEEVVFRNGKLGEAEHAVAECGCPAPPAPVMRAAVVPPLPNLSELRKSPPPSLSLPLDEPLPPPQSAPAPAPQAGEVHVEVDAPFVFRASDPEAAPAPLVAKLRITAAEPWTLVPLPPPTPPPELRAAAAPPPPAANPKPPKKKFFGRLRAFFASIFH